MKFYHGENYAEAVGASGNSPREATSDVKIARLLDDLVESIPYGDTGWVLNPLVGMLVVPLTTVGYAIRTVEEHFADSEAEVKICEALIES